MIIGSRFLVKINITSAIPPSLLRSKRVENAVGNAMGADTVMDLPRGRNIHETREWILRNSLVLIGS